MFEDSLFHLSKLFCMVSYLPSKRNFIPNENISYKIRFFCSITGFCFLSSYIRVYLSVGRFVKTNGRLTLNNYIYLANAVITVFIICLQVSIKRIYRDELTRLINRLRSTEVGFNLEVLRMARSCQFIFLLTIVTMLLYINLELQPTKTFVLANFINETFIEMVSFLDTFEYFNNTLAILRGLSWVRENFRKGRPAEVWHEYIDLCDICEKMNRIYGLSISAVIGFIFLWTMFDAYVFFNILLTGEYTGWKDFIRCAPWVVLHTLKLIILLILPTRCKTVAESIKPIIFDEITGWDECESLKRYFQVINRRVKFFSYSDWFEIDYTFFISMFGTIITYLAILYQFTNAPKV